MCGREGGRDLASVSVWEGGRDLASVSVWEGGREGGRDLASVSVWEGGREGPCFCECVMLKDFLGTFLLPFLLNLFSCVVFYVSCTFTHSHIHTCTHAHMHTHILTHAHTHILTPSMVTREMDIAERLHTRPKKSLKD